MPPDSKFLWEEGMCVKSFKLVKNGIFQEEGWSYYTVVYSHAGMLVCVRFTFIIHYIKLVS